MMIIFFDPVLERRAVIPLIWWGFENQNLWKKSKAALLSLLQDPDLGVYAPYIFHSVAFGSEPIGDSVDGSHFLADLSAFKKAMQPYGIPVTISEDWDRPGSMSSEDSAQLGPVGKQVANVVDLLHVHGKHHAVENGAKDILPHVILVMPYYHADLYPTSSDAWPYFVTYIKFLKETMPNKQILISQVSSLLSRILPNYLHLTKQTLWSSEIGSHER